MIQAAREPLGMNARIPYQLPTAWRWMKLGELSSDPDAFADGPFGSRLKTEHYASAGARVVRLQNIGRGTFLDADKAFISMDHFAMLQRHSVKPGDVIVAALGDGARPAGRACIIPDDIGPGVVKADCFRIRLSDQTIHSPYLVAFLNSPQALRRIADAMRGATRPRVTLEMVRDTWVPLAPPSDQRRIAGTLKQQMAVVERACPAAEARLAAAGNLLPAYLRAAFAPHRTKAWQWARLGEVCTLLPSRSVMRDGNVSVRAITTACLTESGFRPSGVKEARMRSLDARECSVALGEVLVARSNTPDLVGRAAMFAGDPGGAVASDLTIRIMPGPKLVPEFVAFFLSALYVTGYWRERAGGASGSMKKITRSQIEAELIPVPPQPEQEALVADLRPRLAAADSLCRDLKDQLTAVQALPAALLRCTFGGEL